MTEKNNLQEDPYPYDPQDSMESAPFQIFDQQLQIRLAELEKTRVKDEVVTGAQKNETPFVNTTAVIADLFDRGVPNNFKPMGEIYITDPVEQ